MKQKGFSLQVQNNGVHFLHWYHYKILFVSHSLGKQVESTMWFIFILAWTQDITRFLKLSPTDIGLHQVSSFPNSLSSLEWKVRLDACTTVALFTQTGKKGKRLLTYRTWGVRNTQSPRSVSFALFCGISFRWHCREAGCIVFPYPYVPTAPWVSSYHTQLKWTISRKSFQQKSYLLWGWTQLGSLSLFLTKIAPPPQPPNPELLFTFLKSKGQFDIVPTP